ncbi:unnamed protein product [Phytophthora fragariaefolia]|uniref:Unnamed protein product n=1 Tax=Phytophthora fragariaefolia TaxID=1490495 RepID=A0A9W6YA57_9STRA|nr:unnamed protein product [Phytophthora fragariaefolia]
MATHPTFYVCLLKPYRPTGAAEPAGSTASQRIDRRRPPSPERTVPREPGQGQEREQEPLRGVPLAPPSVPLGHTDSGSRRAACASLGALLRRSSRLANIGPAGGRPRHHGSLSAKANPTRGLADNLSPGGYPGASPGGHPHLGREREPPPCQSTGHPAVLHQPEGSPGQGGSQSGDVLHQPEGSPGQGGSQSGDAARPGRTPLPSRPRRICLVMRASSTTMSRSY